MLSLRVRRLGGFGDRCVDDMERVQEGQGTSEPTAQHFGVGDMAGSGPTAQEEPSVMGGMQGVEVWKSRLKGESPCLSLGLTARSS